MALTQKQLKDVCCVLGGYKRCMYVDEDKDSNQQIIHVCKKKSPDKKIIDEEVDEFLKDCKNKGQDPALSGLPLGNNCAGYIVLKDKPQGYDVKN